MSKRRRVTPCSKDTAAGYPSWSNGPHDPSRRRFLRQVSAGAGAAGLLTVVGLPDLAHGQSTDVDFSVLEAHPARSGLVPAQPAAPAAAAVPMAAAPPAAPAPPAPPEEPTDEVEQVVTGGISENRALWIEPGYLLMLTWTRPEENSDVIAALEGSTETIGTYLSENVATVDDLHDVSRLHVHENAIALLLETRVAPATIGTIHLDHDCNTVCNQLDGGDPIDHIPLPGIAPEPYWE